MTCSNIHLEDIEKMNQYVHQSHDNWVSWCKFVGVADELRDATWNYYRVQYYCEIPDCKCGLAKYELVVKSK